MQTNLGNNIKVTLHDLEDCDGDITHCTVAVICANTDSRDQLNQTEHFDFASAMLLVYLE